MSGRSVSMYSDTSASHEYLCTLIQNEHEFCKQWRRQGGGARGGQMPSQNYFLPSILPLSPQFLIISVETISRWEPWV